MLWFANALILIGMWSLGHKWRHAFLFSVAGESIWSSVAWTRGDIELASICLVFCVVTLRNWWKWGADA